MELICKIEFMQPPLLHSLFHDPLWCGHHIWKLPNCVTPKKERRRWNAIFDSHDRIATSAFSPGQSTHVVPRNSQFSAFQTQQDEHLEIISSHCSLLLQVYLIVVKQPPSSLSLLDEVVCKRPRQLPPPPSVEHEEESEGFSRKMFTKAKCCWKNQWTYFTAEFLKGKN